MQKINSYIQNANNPELLKQLRYLIRMHPTLNEEFKWNMPVYTLHGKDVCYLKDTKNGVNVGFTKSQQLIDDRELLEGTGKDMRHMKVASVDELERKRSELINLIKQAINLD